MLGYPIAYDAISPEQARREDALTDRPSCHTDDVLAFTQDCGPQTTSCVLDITGEPARGIEQFVHAPEAELRR